MRCSSALALLVLVAGHASAQQPSALEGRLAPDGRTVAVRALDGASVRLLIVEPYDSLSEPRWVGPADAGVESIAWTPDGTRVVYRAAQDGHLYVVPVGADGGATPPLDLTPGLEGSARLAGFAGDTAAFVELPGEWAGFPDLYRVSLSVAEPAMEQRNDGAVVRWIVDDGEARLAVREGEGNDTEIARLRDGSMVPIYLCGDAEVCEPAGFHPDGRVWVRTSRDRAAPGLILVDPLTLDTEVVRAALGVDTAAVVREDSTYARDVARLRMLVEGAEIAFQGDPEAAGSRVLVSARDSTEAALYVFDRWAGSVVRVLALADPSELLAARVAAPAPDVTLEWPERLRYRVSDGEPGMPPTDVRRTIRRGTEGGREVLVVVDATEVPVFPTFPLDTALLLDPAFEPDLSFSFDELETEEATDTTVLDARTLLPIRRRATGPFAVALDFGPDGVRGSVTMDGFETPVAASAEGPVWADGSALELLVAALPLAEEYETDLSYFDASLQDVVDARLSVAGTTRARTESGEFDAWTVTISPNAPGAGEWTWLVRMAAPHVLLSSTVESRDFVRTTELIEGGRTP